MTENTESVKILIVEDDGVIGMHLAVTLQRMGYTVMAVARSGEEAIQLLGQPQPDLVLLDIALAGEMDGTETAARLQQRWDVPVVYLTGYADEAILQRVKTTKPFGYILKPFETQSLRVTVEMALHQHLLEKQVRESEARFRSVFEKAAIGIAITTVQGQFIQINPAFEAMLGYNLQEIEKLGGRGITYPEDFPREQTLFKDVIAQRLEFFELEKRYIHKDGSLIWGRLLVSSVCNEQNEIQFVIGLVEDITQAKQSEAERSQREHEMNALVEFGAALRSAENRTDTAQIITRQTLALMQAESVALLAYDPHAQRVHLDAVIGAWEAVPQPTWPSGPLKEFQSSWEDQTYVNNQAAGDPALSKFLLNPLPDALACIPLIAHEETIGLLCIGRQHPIQGSERHLLTAVGDIAANAFRRALMFEDLQDQLQALQSAQTRLVQSEKLAAVGELVAGVAHELNNPLTSVILFAQLLQQRAHLPDEKRDLDRIVNESQRAANIVRGLLDFARQRPPQRKAVQINDVLRATLEFLAYELRTHNIAWEIDLSPTLPETQADPYQLQQIFVNLMTNAWQAMYNAHSGGKLKITTRKELSTFRGQSDLSAPVILITFRDDGPGIPASLLPRIFDPFFTTKREGEGSGLGLAICHGIVSEHGGHIWAESLPGQGSAFFVELPWIYPPHDPVSAPQPSGASQEQSDGHILVIDDEVSILTAMSRILKRHGYRVDTTNNAINAFDYLDHFIYDLVLCDVRMPGISGTEFYRLVQEKYPRLVGRLLFISGDIVSQSTLRFFEANNIPLLAKPFELNDLLNRVEAIIEGKPHQP